MQYIITNKLKQIVDTNIENSDLINSILECTIDCERVFCEKNNKYRRQGFFASDTLNYYLCSFDQNITNRIFRFYFDAFSILSNQLETTLENQKIKEKQKNRRLKHNLITHSSNILQELYKLFPQDSFRNGNNHIDTIENIIKKDTKKSAYTFLKVLKNSNLMKAEFDVYEMLETESPYLDFSKHSIHKVLILTLNPFWLDLVEHNVTINIESYHGTVTIDYKSISVVLSHLFDNMSKYIMPDSELNISFAESHESVTVYIEMNSLQVKKDELQNLFSEGHSGEWAKKLEIEGDGIGMFVAKKLTELNCGTIKMEVNIDNKTPVVLDGIPYERNRVIINIKK